jgi:hypothetical protein
MEFYRARIAARDTKTYEVKVEFEGIGKHAETAKFLSPSVSSPTGGGFFTLPPIGSSCLVIRDAYNDYWVLGYYNYSNPGSTNGWLLDEKYPRPVIGDGDTLLRHHSGGNYILQTNEELRVYQGMSAKMSLTGGKSSTFDLTALRLHLNNTAGYLSWKTTSNKPEEDTPSKFEWKIQRNFEQQRDIAPSDYMLINAGTVGEEKNNHIFEINTKQYVSGTADESADVYLSLSRDNDDNLLALRIKDIDNEGNSSYTINKGYWHNLTISDSSRTVKLDIMPDTNTNLKLDLNSSVVITAKEDGNLNAEVEKKVHIKVPEFNVESSLVNLGSKDASEPLALGDSLMNKLNELIDIFNAHIHPTPAGPAGPPAGPFTKYVSTDFLSKVSKSD